MDTLTGVYAQTQIRFNLNAMVGGGHKKLRRRNNGAAYDSAL